MSKSMSKQSKDFCLKDTVLATKEYNLSESEVEMIQDAQEIEERVSKSFLAIDAFTPELQSPCGSGSGSGSGGGCCVSYCPCNTYV